MARLDATTQATEPTVIEFVDEQTDWWLSRADYDDDPRDDDSG